MPLKYLESARNNAILHGVFGFGVQRVIDREDGFFGAQRIGSVHDLNQHRIVLSADRRKSAAAVDVLHDHLVLHRVGRCVRHGVVDDGLGRAVLHAVQFDLIRCRHQTVGGRGRRRRTGFRVQRRRHGLVHDRCRGHRRQRVVHVHILGVRLNGVELALIRRRHQAVGFLRCGRFVRLRVPGCHFSRRDAVKHRKIFVRVPCLGVGGDLFDQPRR